MCSHIINKISISLSLLIFIACNNPSTNKQANINNIDSNKALTNKNVDSTKFIKHDSSINKCPKPEKIEQKYMNLGIVAADDSIISIYSSKYLDHQIFGYQKPDTNSKKMIVISCFTYDVSNNIYNCPYGAYYNSFSIDSLQLKFLAKQKKFALVQVQTDEKIIGKVYIEKRWLKFENSSSTPQP